MQDPILLCGWLLLLFWQDAGGWLRLSLLAAVLHECGHIAAFLLLTGQWPQIDVTVTGFCMRATQQGLPCGQEALVTLAGPAVNLLLALLCRCGAGYTGGLWRVGFLWANVLTGGFNLLPLPPLDGWRLLALLRQKLHFPPE